MGKVIIMYFSIVLYIVLEGTAVKITLKFLVFY